MKDRIANWRKWRTIPDVTLVEAVALSLNIDPDGIRSVRDQAQVDGFQERLDILNRNCGHGRPLVFVRERRTSYTGDGQPPTIRLSQFAGWAHAQAQWNVPDELKEIATEPTRESLQARISELELQAKHLKADATDLSPAQRPTLLKLGAYLARRFGYDPGADRSAATEKVRQELERYGIALNEKTVRKLLQASAERFPKIDDPKP